MPAIGCRVSFLRQSLVFQLSVGSTWIDIAHWITVPLLCLRLALFLDHDSLTQPSTNTGEWLAPRSLAGRSEDRSQIRRNQAAAKTSRTNTAKYRSDVTSSQSNSGLDNHLEVDRCPHFVKSIGKIMDNVETQTTIKERIHCGRT